MKIILNEDVANLGEEGDVKIVKNGYARNYLIPRGFAVPHTKGNVKVFEARKDIIEKKKEEKRKAAMGEKEKIESLEITIPMSAGQNGRLFGSVTNALICDLLAKHGIQIERKKIELSEHSIKATGNYSAKIKLYENEIAQLNFSIVGDTEKTDAQAPAKPKESDSEKSEEAVTENSVEESIEEPSVSEEEVKAEEIAETVSDAITNETADSEIDTKDEEESKE